MCLQVESRAEQAHQGAGRGVGQGHAQGVARGQQQGARAAGALADDDRTQDRNHRQHAGREGQPEAGEEEQPQSRQQAGIREQCAEAGIGAADRGCCGATVRRRRRTARLAGGRHQLREGGRGTLLTGLQSDGLRRIAEPGIGAALEGDGERDRAAGRCVFMHCLASGGAHKRDANDQRIMEDMHLAHIGIVLQLSRRQVGVAQSDLVAGGREAELMTIEVIAFGAGEADIQGVALAPAARLEGFTDRQEIALIAAAEQAGRRTAGAAVNA